MTVLERCEHCGAATKIKRTTSLALRLAKVGPEWTVIATRQSRWAVRELRKRHPAYEYRGVRETLYGGDAGRWTVEARRAR